MQLTYWISDTQIRTDTQYALLIIICPVIVIRLGWVGWANNLSWMIINLWPVTPLERNHSYTHPIISNVGFQPQQHYVCTCFTLLHTYLPSWWIVPGWMSDSSMFADMLALGFQIKCANVVLSILIYSSEVLQMLYILISLNHIF